MFYFLKYIVRVKWPPPLSTHSSKRRTKAVITRSSISLGIASFSGLHADLFLPVDFLFSTDPLFFHLRNQYEIIFQAGTLRTLNWRRNNRWVTILEPNLITLLDIPTHHFDKVLSKYFQSFFFRLLSLIFVVDNHWFFYGF